MRRVSTKRAIRNTLYRLGLHTTPKAVVHALAQQGVRVSEELVRQVRFEMLNDSTAKRIARVSRPMPSPVMRRRPRGFRGDTRDETARRENGSQKTVSQRPMPVRQRQKVQALL